MEFKKIYEYYLFIEVIFEESNFELKKSGFEVKHTCTF
jgi:hypothetical protein